MLLHPRRRLVPALFLAVLLVLALPSSSLRAAPVTSPLVAQPSSYDFGLVGVQSGENGTTVAVQNPGPADVIPNAASIDGPGAGAFRITGDGCNGQLLSAGNTCYLNVGFDPSDGVAYAATLRVPSDTGLGDLTIALAGLGGVQEVTPTPAQGDFGAIDVGESATRTITLANTGTLPYQAIIALPSGSGVGAFRVTQDTCSLQRLDPDMTCTLTVRFAPETLGETTANVMVIGGNDAPALIPLKGSGIQARAVIAPAGADFGAQRRRRVGPLQTLNVVNAGGGTLRIAAVALGGLDAGQFRIAGESCTAAPLAPAAACAVRVRFVPSAVGPAGATLRLLTNDAATVATAALGGRGLPALRVVPRRRACAARYKARPARCRPPVRARPRLS